MTKRRELLKLLSVAGAAGAAETWKTPVVSTVVLPAHAATTQVTCTEIEYFRQDISAGSALISVSLIICGVDYTVDISDFAGTDGFNFTGSGTVGGGETQLTDTSGGSNGCIDLDAFFSVLSASDTQAITDYRNSFPFGYSGEVVTAGTGTVTVATCAGPNSPKITPGSSVYSPL